MAVSEHTCTAAPSWSRSRQLFALIWLLGVLFFGILALSPLRFPFLEYPLVGALSLDYVLHSLGFAWLAAAFPLLFDSLFLLCVSPPMLALLSVILEFWQMHIPNRRFSEKDIVAGMAGVLLGTLCGMLIRRIQKRKAPRSSQPA